MKKQIDVSHYAGIECKIHSFKQDSNGNPIALFDVYAYKWCVQTSPTACLRQAKKRKQVSYAGTHGAYGDDALRAAGIDSNSVTFSHASGSRSEDCITAFYHVVK